MKNARKSEVSRERQKALELACSGWIRRLIDLSRRNNLLYYRALKTGTLDLTESNAKALTALLAGESVSLTRLLPHAKELNAAVRVQEIRGRAINNKEEKGLETLFLALGMATWTTADGGRPPEAAVFLVSITVETRGLVKLQRRGEVQVNPVLLHILETEYGCIVTPQDLLGDAESVTEDEIPDLSAVYAQLTEAAREVRGFEVNSRAVLSNFSFQRMYEKSKVTLSA